MTWYEEEIRELEIKKPNAGFDAAMIFYGSSSIRLWETLYEDFKEFKPLNLGFGGSTLEACVWYFDRIIGSYNPKSMIVYAGDNDLGDGRQPLAVLNYFKQLVLKIRHHFEGLPFAFISIKPSLSRLDIISKIILTNQLIEEEINQHHTGIHFINVFDKMLNEHRLPRTELYHPDGLHLSQQGYDLWKQIIYADKFIKNYLA